MKLEKISAIFGIIGACAAVMSMFFTATIALRVNKDLLIWLKSKYNIQISHDPSIDYGGNTSKTFRN